MHDDLLERRLQAALHAEGDSLPFTITPDELRRRLEARRRARIGRSSLLLIAAALGVGLVGVGAAVGGMFTRRDADTVPVPTSAVALESTPNASASVTPVILPTIDALVETDGTERLVLAQSNGPDAGPAADPREIDLDPPSLSLGPMSAPGDYRITFACLGPTSAGVAIEDPAQPDIAPARTIACNGELRQLPAHVDASGIVRLELGRRASWRLAVHRLGGAVPTASGDPAYPGPADGEEQLIEVSGQAAPDVGDQPMTTVGLATRERYSVELSCTNGATARYAFVARGTGEPVMTTVGVVPCDGLLHQDRIAIGELLPGELELYGAAGTTWALQVSAPILPIALAGNEDQPGWQVSSGFGPNYTAKSQMDGVSLVANQNAASGPILVVFSCAGTGSVTGYVDVGKREGEKQIPLDVPCSPGGSTATKTYQIDAPYITFYYTAPPRSYLAATVFEPKP